MPGDNLNIYNTTATTINDKMRFIRAVINGDIIIFNRNRDDIYQQMQRLNFPIELLRTVRFSELSEDYLESLTQ